MGNLDHGIASPHVLGGSDQKTVDHNSLKSSGTSPNFFSTTASENSPTFGSPARLNATAPALTGSRTAVTRVAALEADIATLKEVVTKAQALAEQRRQETETAARRVEALEAQIATLENTVANAEAPGERRRQEAETAAKRVQVLEAHIAQVAIGIRLAIIMGEGRIAGLDLERLQGIADSVAGLKTVS